MISDVLVAFVVFQAVFFLLDIYIYTKTNRDIASKSEYTSFDALITVHMAYLVLNSLWSLQEYGALYMPRALALAVCTLSLWTVTGCALFFFLFSAEQARFALLRRRHGRLLSMLPAALSTVLIVVSPWTGWVVTLEPSRQVAHGPLYPVMLAVSSLYLLGVAAIATRNLLRADTTQKRHSSAAHLASVLLIVLFVLLDDQLMQASILPAAIFAVIIVIFVTMQESNIYSDALTGMNNRRKAEEFLTDQLQGVGTANPMFLFIGDLNGFKGINDRYGHLEGDDALIVCANVLKRTIAAFNGFASRYGGDEFLLSWQPEQGDVREPQALIDEVNALLSAQADRLDKPYRMSMSVGWTRCVEKGEPLNTCVQRADEMLYRVKAAYYSEHVGK